MRQCVLVFISAVRSICQEYIFCREDTYCAQNFDTLGRLIQPFTDRTATICRKEACCAFRISGVRSRYVALLAWVWLSGAGPGRARLKVNAAFPRGRGGPNFRRTHSLA